MTREWPFLLCVRREWGFIFFPWFVNLYFSVLGNWFSIFSWSVKYAFTFVCEPTTFAGIIFHIFGDLASLKLVNYTILDAKPAHSMRLRMKNWWRTKHSNNEPGGPRICNHGQESWDKFALMAFLSTRQTWIQPHLPNPHLQYNAENYLQFLLSFNIVLEGRGRVTRF